FFQAEDGIRDGHVTGVQTCALPIFYTAFGERARTRVSTITYTSICYSVCAVLLLAVCLVGGVRMTGYAPSTWLAIGGLVVGAQRSEERRVGKGGSSRWWPDPHTRIC